MPIGTDYEFVDDNGDPVTPDTNKLGKQDLKIKVTFPDKSTKIVPAKMDVVPKDNIVKVDDPDNTPVPTGFVRVTLVNDTKSVKDFKETYDVKVSANIKFGEVLRQAGSTQPNDKYTTPITWKNNGIEVDKLGTVLETATLTAFAKLKDSEAYDPKVQDQTVKQGETPKAEDSISNKDDLPDGTKYEFVDDQGKPVTPDTSKPGTQKPNVKVTYPDGSSEIVGPTTITVVPDKDIIPVTPGKEDETKTPDGYVRVTLTKDENSVDFKANVSTSYDVKNDGSVIYGQVVEEVGASAKDGYKDLKWYKDNSEVSLLDKVTGTKAMTLNAKAENKDSIIPVQPGDESKPAREGYVRVKLTHDETVTFQAGAETAYDVKDDGSVRYADVYSKVNASAKEGYKNLTWYQDDTAVRGTEIVKTELTLNAKAVNGKDIIEVPDPTDPNHKTPDGYVMVTLTRDENSVDFKANAVTTYDVNANGTVRYADVYAKVEAKPADGYKDLKWYENNSVVSGNEKVTQALTLNAKAENANSIIPVKPGEEGTTTTPEGYVRVTLNHDETVTFATNAVTTYDVKADGTVRYSDLCEKVSAEPAQGFADMKWYKNDRAITLTDRLTEKTAFELIAKAVHSDNIIPVKPGDEEKPSPNGYVRVNLTKDDKSVQFTATDAPTSYDVKADNTVSLADVAAKVQAQTNDGYKNLKWYKGDEEIRLTDKVSGNTAITIKAMAEKDIADSIIPVKPGDENNPTPKGYVRVTITAGDGVKNLAGVTTYDVKSDKSVRYADLIAKISVKDIDQDKDIVATLKAEYQKPLTFKVDGNDVNTNDYPSRATTMVVGATEKDSNKYTAEPQEQRVNQGEEPKAEDSIKNKDQLPDGTKYEFVDDNGKPTKPDTDTPGEKDVKIKVTYPDGSEETVDTTIKVEKNKPEKPIVDPIKEGDDKVVVTPPTDGDKVIVELPDGTKVEAEKDPDTGDWTATETNPDGTPKTDPDTGKPVVTPVEVNDEGKLEIPVDPDKVKPGDKPVEVTVKDSETGKTSDPTEVPIVAIPKQLEQIKLSVVNLYDGRTGIAVLTNPIEATIVVYKDGEEVGISTTNALGKVTIVLTKNMIKGEKYIIKASKDGYLPNEITMTVK